VRECRSVAKAASLWLTVEAVSAWLGSESHMPKPAHVMTEDADMAAALKESIAAVRKPARDQKDRKT
jgi:hypothetical protein